MLAHIDEYNQSLPESEQVQTSVELEKPARPELGMSSRSLEQLQILSILTTWVVEAFIFYIENTM
jgi:hypothetical protein